MRRDFDYVTMEDYRADMKESADRAVWAIKDMRRRKDEIERLLMLVLVSVGTQVRIDRGDVIKLAPGEDLIEMIQTVDPATESYIVQAKWKR